jgi:pimeloyl-ACP methyl ester carboxylesterase
VSTNSLSINDRMLLTPDGTRIAYRVEGAGPALVLSNGLTTTTTFWKYLRPRWLRDHTVLTWDLPGHGNSGPAQSDASARIEAQPSFVAQLMGTLGIARAAQIGWSTGTQVVLEIHRQFPELCSSLTLLFGGAGHALATSRLPLDGDAIDWLMCRLPRPVFAASCRVLSTAMRGPGALTLGRRLGLLGSRVSRADVREITAHIARVDPRSLQLLVHSCQAHSAWDSLAGLRLPLLIAAGDRDPFAPAEAVGVPIHRAAPHSRLLRLPEATHTALLEEPDRIGRAVEEFLADAQGGLGS